MPFDRSGQSIVGTGLVVHVNHFHPTFLQVWIIGEYAERIDNADELLETFLDTFPEETSMVCSEGLGFRSYGIGMGCPGGDSSY